MASEPDIDIEIVDLASAYTLYAASLVTLAISYNKGEGISEANHAVRRHRRHLAEKIFRCNLNVDIPETFESAEEAMMTLMTGSIVNQISNHLTREYSSRQEKLFLFAVVMGGIMTADVGGIGQSADAARLEVRRFGRMLDLPPRLINIASEDPENGFKQLKRYVIKARPQGKTRVEFWLETLKNHKIISAAIFLAIVLIALAAFTDAVSTIYERLIIPFLKNKSQ